jgi:hypothetical protein
VTRVFAALVALLASAPALGDEKCPMNQAIYTQPGSGYEVRFHPVPMGPDFNASATNAFTLIQPFSEDQLAGEVIGNNGVSRPTGAASLDCDSEDASSNCEYCADDGCVYWSGVMYALGDHNADLLPYQDEMAPQTILLSDFGRQIRYADADFDIGTQPVPDDVFQLTGCAK